MEADAALSSSRDCFPFHFSSFASLPLCQSASFLICIRNCTQEPASLVLLIFERITL